MRVALVYAAALLRTALCCGDGLILCPPGTNSSGVCVPLQRWCNSLPYLNPFAAPEERVGDLLSRLTLPEKVNLLQSGPINISSVPRLQVPRTTFAECLHGYCSGTPSSLFPQSISLAATFNPSLVTRVAAAIGMEARAWRNRWEAAGDFDNATNPPPSLSCFAPQINIVRGVLLTICQWMSLHSADSLSLSLSFCLPHTHRPPLGASARNVRGVPRSHAGHGARLR